jgi:hypothetical protein
MDRLAKKQTWGSVIADELRAVKSGRGDLRKFGITMAVGLGVLGALFLWRGKGEPMIFFGLAALFLVLGLAIPAVLRPVQRAWMAFAIVLGWVMTRVILVVLFFVGVTPVALIARVVGKRFLSLGFEPERASYWERREKPDRGIERYESQF